MVMLNVHKSQLSILLYTIYTFYTAKENHQLSTTNL